jgi:hypothetical protein
MSYLCYDVRGIQSFIFQVPRLRHVVGGSALIDRFDRDTVPALARGAGWTRIFSAGGRGAFRCQSDAEADQIQSALLREGHRIGVDLRVGRDDDFSEAAHCADWLFPYLPSGGELDGHPCHASGLYPVPGDGSHTEHGVIKRRVFDRGSQLARWFENRLLTAGDLGLPSAVKAKHPVFIRDVSPDPETAEDDDARRASNALGARNRWAVVCMDGNDMGAQFRHAVDTLRNDEETLTQWTRRVSEEVDACTHAACQAGIRAVVEEWGIDANWEEVASEDEVFVPLRPLLLGGDDIVVLVHSRHAFAFVEAACARFASESVARAEAARAAGIDLWPATAGALSISAGILFAPVNLPLHSAVPYAEGLLASAKQRGRESRREGHAVPPCVDWDAVTEGLLDHPALRRQRSLRFLDEDIGEVVELTRRPYRLADLGELRRFAKQLELIPRTLRQQVLPSLRTGFHDRQVFLARLGKHQPALVSALDEMGLTRPREAPPAAGQSKTRWRQEADREGRRCRSTDVVDALLLLEETARMAWETT